MLFDTSTFFKLSTILADFALFNTLCHCDMQTRQHTFLCGAWNLGYFMHVALVKGLKRIICRDAQEQCF